VTSAEQAYVFRHALLRAAAYQLQLPADRARLHRLAFDVTEQIAGKLPAGGTLAFVSERPLPHAHCTLDTKPAPMGGFLDLSSNVETMSLFIRETAMKSRFAISLVVLFVAASLVRGGPSTPDTGFAPQFAAWREYLATYSVSNESKLFESSPARLRCSPDGTTLLAAGPGENATLLDASTFELLFTLKGHSKKVNDAVFSPDGKYVLTASDDQTARLWEAASGKELRSFTGHEAAVTSGVFSPDGKQCATGSLDGSVRIWDVDSGKKTASVKNSHHYEDEEKGDLAGVLSVAWSLDGARIYAGCDSGQHFYASTGEDPSVIGSSSNSSKERFTRTEFTANNSHILRLSMAAGAKFRGNSLELCGFGVGSHSANLHEEHPSLDFALDFSGRFLCAVSANALDLFELDIKPPKNEDHYLSHDTLKSFATLNLKDKTFTGAAFGADGKLFTATSDGSIQCWSGKEEAPERLPKPKILRRSKRNLEYESSDREISKETLADPAFKEWINFYKSMRAPKTTTARVPQVSTLAFTAEGNLLCASGKRALVLNSETFDLVLEFAGHTGAVTDAVISPDGKYVATSSEDSNVRIFNAKSGVLLQTLSRHKGAVNVVRFSPDSTKLASGGDDGRVGIFEVESGKMLGWGKFEQEDYRSRSGKTTLGEATMLSWNPAGDEVQAFARKGYSMSFDMQGKGGSWITYTEREFLFVGYSGDLRIEATDDSRVRCEAGSFGENGRSGYIEGPFDVTALTLSANVKFLWLATEQGKLRVYPLRVPENEKTKEGYRITSLGCSSEIDLPKGRRILGLTASLDSRKIAGLDEKGRIIVWSTDIDPPKDE
jgi:WD40 repeat protein